MAGSHDGERLLATCGLLIDLLSQKKAGAAQAVSGAARRAKPKAAS